VGWIRAAFVVGALVGGLGIALYLACWLIIPVRGDAEQRPGPTVFGFGWIVVGMAAVILVGVVVGRPALGPAWALLPVAARGLIEPEPDEAER
jgi:hypothetical protein